METKKKPIRRFRGYNEVWVQRKLGEMMDVTSVKRIHQSDWTDSGVRFLRARDIVAESKNEETTEPLFISQEKYDEYSAISGKVKPGDILVTGVGTIGVPMLITDHEPVYFKDGNIIWFKNDKVDGKFLYYSFTGNAIQKYIEESAGIGTVGTYTIDSGKNTPIVLPTQKEEQENIGEYFSNLDNLIALHQRKYDKFQSLKKAYLSEMFPLPGEKRPKRRFAGFTGDWEQRKLGDVSEIRTGPFGSVLHAEDYVSDGTPIVTTEHFKTGSLPVEKECLPQVSDMDYNRLNSYKLERGDIVFSRVGSVDVNALVEEEQAGWLFSGRVLRVRPQRTINGRCLHYLLETNGVKNDIISRAVGQTMPSINTEILNATTICIPDSQDEQYKIGEYFANLDNLIALHQRKLAKLQALKKAYLTEMFP